MKRQACLRKPLREFKWQKDYILLNKRVILQYSYKNKFSKSNHEKITSS